MKIKEQKASRRLYLSMARWSWRGLKRFSKSIKFCYWLCQP